MPVAALNNPRVRSHFMGWRSTVAQTSGLREADYTPRPEQRRASADEATVAWTRSLMG